MMSIKKSAENLSEEIRRAQKCLDLMLRNAKSTLRALNIELSEEAAERNSPIALPSGLTDASDALAELPRKTGTDG